MLKLVWASKSENKILFYCALHIYSRAVLDNEVFWNTVMSRYSRYHILLRIFALINLVELHEDGLLRKSSKAHAKSLKQWFVEDLMTHVFVFIILWTDWSSASKKILYGISVVLQNTQAPTGCFKLAHILCSGKITKQKYAIPPQC